MTPEQLVAELLRQLKEQRQIQVPARTAPTVFGLRRDQMGRMLARIHAAAAQATNFVAQLRGVPWLSYKDE